MITLLSVRIKITFNLVLKYSQFYIKYIFKASSLGKVLILRVGWRLTKKDGAGCQIIVPAFQKYIPNHLHQLQKMNLYLTGTVVRNQVPANLRIAKIQEYSKQGEFQEACIEVQN